MSAICYMTHEEHGAMPVYTNEVLSANLKNGWKRVETKDYIAQQKEANEKKMEGIPKLNSGEPVKIDPKAKQVEYQAYLEGLQVNDLRMMYEASGGEAKGKKKQDFVLELMAIEFEDFVIEQ